MLQWNGCVGSRAREKFPCAVELNHLQVRDTFRGQGVGGALIRAAESLADQAHSPQIAVGVGVDNPDAERLYARLGYRWTGVFDTTSYEWVDGQGQVHQEIERNQLLVKTLGSDRVVRQRF